MAVRQGRRDGADRGDRRRGETAADATGGNLPGATGTLSSGAAVPPRSRAIAASSAAAVAVGIAEREGHHLSFRVSFRQFIRSGLIVTAVTVLIAAAYVWLRHLVLV